MIVGISGSNGERLAPVTASADATLAHEAGRGRRTGDQRRDMTGRLPQDCDLEDLARQTKAIERGRKVISGITLLRLALARGPGGLSLSATAA